MAKLEEEYPQRESSMTPYINAETGEIEIHLIISEEDAIIFKPTPEKFQQFIYDCQMVYQQSQLVKSQLDHTDAESLMKLDEAMRFYHAKHTKTKNT